MFRYLISMTKIREAIIISGEICSGKSTLATAISTTTGKAVASFGGFLRNYCLVKNIEATRQNLQDIGESFIQKDPKLFLARVISYSQGDASIIFEGVRHKSILTEISNGVELLKSIYIETNELTRHERYKAKHLEDLSIEEFRIKCSHPVEREITLLKNVADIVLDGELSIQGMLKRLKAVSII